MLPFWVTLSFLSFSPPLASFPYSLTIVSIFTSVTAPSFHIIRFSSKLLTLCTTFQDAESGSLLFFSLPFQCYRKLLRFPHRKIIYSTFLRAVRVRRTSLALLASITVISIKAWCLISVWMLDCFTKPFWWSSGFGVVVLIQRARSILNHDSVHGSTPGWLMKNNQASCLDFLCNPLKALDYYLGQRGYVFNAIVFVCQLKQNCTKLPAQFS